MVHVQIYLIVHRLLCILSLSIEKEWFQSTLLAKIVLRNCLLVVGCKNWLFIDTPAGADANDLDPQKISHLSS